MARKLQVMGEFASPSNWNAAEGEAGYVHNRTHWVEDGMVEILPETEAVYEENDQAFFIMSPITGITAGEKYTVEYNGVAYETLATEFTEDGMTGTILGNFGGMTGGTDTGEPFVILIYPPEAFAEAGFCGICVPLDGATSVTIGIYGGGEVVHKLDSKFLDLAWLPTMEKADTEVFAEATVASNTNLVKYSVLPVGTNVAVIFDGVRYECSVKLIEENEATIYYFGNLVAVGMTEATDTGEPFGIYTFYESGYYIFRPADGNEHTVAVYKVESTPNKLPEEYLPESVDGIIIRSSTADSAKKFKLTVDDSGTITATEV